MFRTRIDLVGQRFGRLVVVGPAAKKTKFARWACRCDCGAAHEADSFNLKSGSVQSCGCLRSELQVHHGHNRRGSRTRCYNSWTAMLARCTNPRSTKWKDYGGRGIVVCERWWTFENFATDMGDPPPGRSLDRINVNGNYEPSNCRWATASEQSANRRPRAFLAAHQEPKP